MAEELQPSRPAFRVDQTIVFKTLPIEMQRLVKLQEMAETPRGLLLMKRHSRSLAAPFPIYAALLFSATLLNAEDLPQGTPGPKEGEPAAKVEKAPAPTPKPSPLEILDLAISRPKPLSEDSDLDEARYRVIAKVKNRSDRAILLPTLKVRLNSAPKGEFEYCATSLILQPGESGFFCTGGLTTTKEVMKDASTAEILTGSDDSTYFQSGHDAKVNLISRLRFDSTSFEFPKGEEESNDFAYVRGELKNPDHLHLKSVSGIAVFFDERGHLLDGGPFDYNLKKGIPAGGLLIGFEMPSLVKAKTCVMQVTGFEEE